MLTFLFWNIRGKPVEKQVANLVQKHDVDVVLLAESGFAFIDRLLNQLPTGFDLAPGQCRKIEIVTRFPRVNFNPLLEDERFTIRNIQLPDRLPFLLVATHMISKYNNRDALQQHESYDLARQIKTAESLVKHQRTLLVGDLNMNPYEVGVSDVGGLNAVMTKAIATEKTKRSQRAYFYNPMWAFFGDGTEGAPGTYFYRNSGTLWHMYDQVLLRPDLLHSFSHDNLKILTSDGHDSFLNRAGQPNQKYSDHLPLLFSLAL